MSPEYEEFLKSDVWKATAHSVFCRAGGQCERCGTAEGPHHAHHLTYIAGNRDDAPSWVPSGWLPEFPWIVCLCEDCHRLLHRRGLLFRTREGCKILQNRRRDQKRRLIVIEVPCHDFGTENGWFMCRGHVVA